MVNSPHSNSCVSLKAAWLSNSLISLVANSSVEINSSIPSSLKLILSFLSINSVLLILAIVCFAPKRLDNTQTVILVVSL